MEHQIIRRIKNLFVALATVVLMQSCYYDNVEELYPVTPDCDTASVSYAEDVWPVINSNCTSCHSGGAPQGNVHLENYNDIVVAASNGSLLGVIRHDDGWPAMPKGGGKLGDCDIAKIEKWVADGTPEN
ncbi:MAG: cytochrome c [bacterium]|jgi:mono/diheme cytochrome c family protein